MDLYFASGLIILFTSIFHCSLPNSHKRPQKNLNKMKKSFICFLAPTGAQGMLMFVAQFCAYAPSLSKVLSLSAAFQQSLSSLSEISQQSLSSLLAVSSQSPSSLLAVSHQVSKQSLTSLSPVSQQSLSSLLAVSQQSLSSLLADYQQFLSSFLGVSSEESSLS